LTLHKWRDIVSPGEEFSKHAGLNNSGKTEMFRDIRWTIYLCALFVFASMVVAWTPSLHDPVVAFVKNLLPSLF
jgi:hypothetical protein